MFPVPGTRRRHTFTRGRFLTPRTCPVCGNAAGEFEAMTLIEDESNGVFIVTAYRGGELMRLLPCAHVVELPRQQNRR